MSPKTPMQFIDLTAQQQRIRTDIERRIARVLDHGCYVMGPEVVQLEEKLAAYAGVKHCLSCSSGTDALLLGLMAWGVGAGDAVFTTPFTFVATAEAAALLGAVPVFVDIDPRTLNIDPSCLERSVEAVAAGQAPSPGAPGGLRPRAVIPVDLFGLPADYENINRIARRHGLAVIEDAAQSFGAQHNGRRAGALAEIAATSFFPAKPLGCYGDGGALFTDRDDIAEAVVSLRIHGQGSDKYTNVRVGINGRLDTLQAAVLLAKLEIFDEELEMRREAAERYRRLLADRFELQEIPSGSRSAWAQFSMQASRRERSVAALADAGIPHAIYYPTPLHLQKAFAYLGYRPESLPIAERTAGRIFSVPMHPYLTAQVQERVCAVLTDCR